MKFFWSVMLVTLLTGCRGSFFQRDNLDWYSSWDEAREDYAKKNGSSVRSASPDHELPVELDPSFDEPKGPAAFPEGIE